MTGPLSGQRTFCSTAVRSGAQLVSADDDLDIHGDPEAGWRPWAAGELRTRPIHCGHHRAEQAPDELALALLDFLGRPPSLQAG